MPEPYWLGIDFGTSGARAVAINAQQHIVAQHQQSFTVQQPAIWQSALDGLILALPSDIRQGLQAIALNGTSSTVLLCDSEGAPLTEPLLYNDDRGRDQVARLRAIAPPEHTVLSATSSLAKLFWWEQHWLPQATPTHPLYFLHQADWLAFLLHGTLGISDYHNALKLGYDVGELCYPDWFTALPLPFQVPEVVAPGTAIAPITPAVAARLGIPSTCQVCAGTTDSIAAFLASGAHIPGDAVTSLGSTLVLKLLSTTRIDESASGIYSHRLGDLWLVGGASNTGGAVLRQFFSDVELQTYSQHINLDVPTSLTYYPLLKAGERFPINDPDLPPQLEPRPTDPVQFLHGLLAGISRIEALGYERLAALGATPTRRVYTAGGGAQNAVWVKMRSRQLGVPVLASTQREAAFGSALLAMDTAPGPFAQESEQR
ncbi:MULTISPECIES: FGGY-family carbohydrate kinase [unclassified Leptolyngbya]|uniref:FGGY-family carbohydrate kinase n=1 Tax=unclassified Leptolyngbya TaxID=2650499 RepID=UPI001688AF48|nr:MULTISPECIES: FGGY-family carbohydrate kinase [unclassified Leptolyngbya]MBD1911015.1 FGGY-family carbohydrate kinase [Leptolyngbya sp. FACHB-8]MBD2158318.1 FGGY-family carbohydrate kinase [Leptolyngbya sp. FACHB-16]